MSQETASEAPRAAWLKRFGAAAFLFFFVKGLLWLLVPFLVLWFGVGS